jgi:uncharacterized damage-inducible protein DinB
MNADAFRHLYDYHFAENRKIWDSCISGLSQEQFVQKTGYSHESVRDQVVHLMNVDYSWFCELRGVEIPEMLGPAGYSDRKALRAEWERMELIERAYLAGLQDEMLEQKPLEGEDKELIVWQVLLHVVNHGTDHRAQLLRMLHDLGVKTESQDYIFYVYEHVIA